MNLFEYVVRYVYIICLLNVYSQIFYSSVG